MRISSGITAFLDLFASKTTSSAEKSSPGEVRSSVSKTQPANRKSAPRTTSSDTGRTNHEDRVTLSKPVHTSADLVRQDVPSVQKPFDTQQTSESEHPAQNFVYTEVSAVKALVPLAAQERPAPREQIDQTPESPETRRLVRAVYGLPSTETHAPRSGSRIQVRA